MRKTAPKEKAGGWRGPNWTKDRLIELEKLLTNGMTDEAIGRQLGRTVNAIRLARRHHGIPGRRQLLMTTTAVAKAMGIPCAKTVSEWIRRGWLRARKGQWVGRYRERYVTEEALYDFLTDPQYGMAWEPKRIRDRRIKGWLKGIPREKWLRTGEVAAQLFGKEVLYH